jgi:scyllo-inositol 2-dehydrogenase (NADP+)
MGTGERLGVGVLGYGYAGRAFHTYLVSLEGARGLDLRAIATRDPQRQAQARRDHPQARVYATLDEMLRDDAVDLVVVATPHDTHRDLALQVLAAGRHVVVDKVMCLHRDEADEMIRAAERAGRVLTVFHNRRWDWDYQTVKGVLARGWLGAPYLFESTVFSYGEPRGWRASRAQGGGILYDWGAHLVDQALQLVPGPVQRVECVTQSRHWRGDAGSYARLTLHFENGVLFVVEVGNLARRAKPRWYVLGETGALVRQARDPQEPYLNRRAIDAADEPASDAAVVYTERDGIVLEASVRTVRASWRAFYQNVADAVLRGAPLAVDPREVRRAIAVFDAAEIASRTGQPVRPEGE